jgi:hypothetical protein
MPTDIAACMNDLCPLRKQCARYSMVRGDHQTYGCFAPESHVVGVEQPEVATGWGVVIKSVITCEGFIPTKPAPWPLRPENECV